MSTEISLISWNDEHFYRIEADNAVHYIPSVTTKLGKVLRKDGLERWRGDIGNREADLRMEEAAERGTRIHQAFETLLKGGACIYNPYKHPVYTSQQISELENKFSLVFILRRQDEMHELVKLKKQIEILKPKVLHVEVKVYDLMTRDAGTIDHVYQIEAGEYSIAGSKPLKLEAGIYIGDLKTGNYLDENVWLQLAAYGDMFERQFKVNIKGALVTHTGAKTRSGIPGLNTLFRDRRTLILKDYSDYRAIAQIWERNHGDDTPKDFVFPSLIHQSIKLGETYELLRYQN